jgi:mono/diheme cytochrome c family protein
MLHDTIMSLVVVSVIAGLAIVWKYTTPGNHHSIEAGWLGRLYDAPADPGTINFVPRPDWYFYFLFYLLRIFKWPETVVIGTVGLPTVLLVILIAVPFIDLRTERRLSRRPVAIVASILVVLSMGVLTYKGATAKEALGSEIVGHVPAWAAKQGFTGNTKAIAGAKLFAVSGCMTCHTYLGEGSSNLGAPVLTAEGAKNKGIAFQIAHLKCPACVNPGSPMPSFAKLGDVRLDQIAHFLEASKGPKG